MEPRLYGRDYSAPTGTVHETFYEEAAQIAKDYVRALQDVDVCIMHDILYQGWHLVHNAAIRQAQKSLPGVRFLAFTHSLPVSRPQKLEEPFSFRFTAMPNTRFVYPSYSGIEALHGNMTCRRAAVRWYTTVCLCWRCSARTCRKWQAASIC